MTAVEREFAVLTTDRRNNDDNNENDDKDDFGLTTRLFAVLSGQLRKDKRLCCCFNPSIAR